MANSNYRKYKREAIKKQLKEQQARKISKELAEQFTTMTDEDWDEVGKKFAEYLANSKKENE